MAQYTDLRRNPPKTTGTRFTIERPPDLMPSNTDASSQIPNLHKEGLQFDNREKNVWGSTCSERPIGDEAMEDITVIQNGVDSGAPTPMIEESVLSWNSRGAKSVGFLKEVKEFMRLYKPMIIALIQPKISGVEADAVCKRLGKSHWARSESEGFSRAILLFGMRRRSLLSCVSLTDPYCMRELVLQVGRSGT